MSEDAAEVAPFDESWDKDTVQAAFNESVQLQAFCSEWSDAIDRKTITIFTLATAIAAAAPGLLKLGGPLHTWALWAVGFASIGGLAAAYCCYRSYRPHDLSVGPDPSELLDKRWIGRSLADYQYYRIRDLGDAFDLNRDTLDGKARWLSLATRATIAEVVFLSLAYLAQALGL